MAPGNRVVEVHSGSPGVSRLITVFCYSVECIGSHIREATRTWGEIYAVGSGFASFAVSITQIVGQLITWRSGPVFLIISLRVSIYTPLVQSVGSSVKDLDGASLKRR